MEQMSLINKTISKLSLLGFNIKEHNDFAIHYWRNPEDHRLIHIPTSGKQMEYANFTHCNMCKHFVAIGNDSVLHDRTWDDPKVFVRDRSSSVLANDISEWCIDKYLINILLTSMIRRNTDVILSSTKKGNYKETTVINKRGQTFNIGRYMTDVLKIPDDGSFEIDYLLDSLGYKLRIGLSSSVLTSMMLPQNTPALFFYMGVDFKPYKIETSGAHLIREKHFRYDLTNIVLKEAGVIGI